jgi:N-acetylglucosaminyldiphosphoundecaprenol N-acetyl-beta-D-mannosaminyltransferase
MAVGAALDTQAKLRRRAPPRVQAIAREWLFRLLMEPRRLWRRYLIGNTRFVLLVMRQWARERSRDLMRGIAETFRGDNKQLTTTGSGHEEN